VARSGQGFFVAIPRRKRRGSNGCAGERCVGWRHRGGRDGPQAGGSPGMIALRNRSWCGAGFTAGPAGNREVVSQRVHQRTGRGFGNSIRKWRSGGSRQCLWKRTETRFDRRPRDEENWGERTARRRSGPEPTAAGHAQGEQDRVNISRAARCHAPGHSRRISTLPHRERWTEVVREGSRGDRPFESPASLPVSTWSRTLLMHCQADRARRVGRCGNHVEGRNSYRPAWLAIEASRNREPKPGGCGIALVAS
jgi:hypothetical protein